MNALLLFLTGSKLPLWKYCLAVFPIALLPSLAMFGCAYLLLLAAGIDTSGIQPPEKSESIGEVLGTVVIAPVVETVLLGLLLRGLLALTNKPFFAAAISSLLWGALHATLGALWFFGTFWSFFVFSCAYIGWRQRSLLEAFAAAAVPHSLINLSVVLVLTFENAA